MITYNKIIPQIVEIWNRDGLFARVNEYELNDLRIQIKTKKVEGFYCVFEGYRIYINKDGSLSHWPKGFFDTMEKQLTILHENL
jgi:predicted ATPase